MISFRPLLKPSLTSFGTVKTYVRSQRHISFIWLRCVDGKGFRKEMKNESYSKLRIFMYVFYFHIGE